MSPGVWFRDVGSNPRYAAPIVLLVVSCRDRSVSLSVVVEVGGLSSMSCCGRGCSLLRCA
jgi:hypothetical protein